MRDRDDIDLTVARLRTLFFRHPQHRLLFDQFDRLLRRRQVEVAEGLRGEARGIALIGPSGCGKTTAAERLIATHPDLVLPAPDRLRADVVSFLVPSPATLKDVGMAALAALGYPLERDKPSGIIWDRVRHFLRERQTLFLHIDEAQDLYTARSAGAQQSVINTLKSLMQNRDWPVGLILTGMPEVKAMLNADPQLARRTYPIEIAPVSWVADGPMIRSLVATYAEKANLSPNTDLVQDDFVARLVHAGATQFGLIVETVIAAIEEALRSGASVLDRSHFAAAFRRRSGCIDGLNPFLTDDYLSIDPRQLFDMVPVAPPASLGGRLR
ncbi:TniB family NTP-binding protein [Palleronia sp. LCG004]|uniref:TniB family NTP-binding protein n=1 Tax=Palleronia sp. LCG004 TaxID=3079304 RepID=UPI0029430663|nr:TniB family NTP-binding protein [Palleronia sp. LCG004]WOI56704.1 TniB family NTP-binding protein [Palleronia sp. LCG004]